MTKFGQKCRHNKLFIPSVYVTGCSVITHKARFNIAKTCFPTSIVFWCHILLTICINFCSWGRLHAKYGRCGQIILQNFPEMERHTEDLSTENTSILIIAIKILYTGYLVVAEMSVLNTAINFTISKKTVLQHLLVPDFIM
jgi:hypothetical protein